MTQTGTQPHGRSGATQQPPSQGAPSGSRGAAASGTGGPDSGRTQRATPETHSDDEFGHSPFGTQGHQETATRHTGRAGADEQSGGARGDRARRRVDDLDAQLGEQSLQLNADVDRLVDVLYRKLERKRRVERQRRGF